MTRELDQAIADAAGGVSLPTLSYGDVRRRIQARTRTRRRQALALAASVGLLAIGLVWIAVPRGTSPDIVTPGSQPGVGGVAPTESTSPKEPVQECTGLGLRPGYLPWLDQGETVQAGKRSYDTDIGRFQLSWTHGEAALALTLLSHIPQGNVGEPTNVTLYGVEGRLHDQDEGGLVIISWELPQSECNYLELILYDPSLTRQQAIQELIRVANSLN